MLGGAGSVDGEGQRVRNMHGRAIVARARDLVCGTLEEMLVQGAGAPLLPTAHAMLQQAQSEINKVLVDMELQDDAP